MYCKFTFSLHTCNFFLALFVGYLQIWFGSVQGLKKPWIPACLFKVYLSNCTCLGQVLGFFCYLLVGRLLTWTRQASENKNVLAQTEHMSIQDDWMTLSSPGFCYALFSDCFMGHHKPQWQITQSQTISWPEQEEFHEYFGEKNSLRRNLKPWELLFFHVED